MERSPITRADRIIRPLLIIQGMNDVRVKPQERADEGHGVIREGIKPRGRGRVGLTVEEDNQNEAW